MKVTYQRYCLFQIEASSQLSRTDRMSTPTVTACMGRTSTTSIRAPAHDENICIGSAPKKKCYSNARTFSILDLTAGGKA